MSDARWGDPREYGERDRVDERPRVYDRDRDDHDPRDGLMNDLDLPRGEERELVVDRDRVYELDGEDSRTLAAVGTFRVMPEQDLEINQGPVGHLRDEGLVEVVELGNDERGRGRARRCAASPTSCPSASRRKTRVGSCFSIL
jgi:hypothetical protein